jgi:tetratricopeptide (TPR) repeat protein
LFTVRCIWLIFLVILPLLPGCASDKTSFLINPGEGLVLEETPYFPQQTFQCGPASLAMLLSASGVATHPDALAPRTYLPGRRGSLQLELVAASRGHNRIPYVIDQDISSLIAELHAGRPVLVLQNLGLSILPAYHYAVAIGVLPPGKIVLRSGNRIRLEMDLGKFLATWERADSWGIIVLRPGELPMNPDLLRYLNAVSAFELGGNLTQAARGYQAARTAWPENQTVLFALGNNYLSRAKYNKAEEIFRKLIKENPNHIAASNNLAETLIRQECYSEAFLVVNEALMAADRIKSPLRDTVLLTRKEISQHLRQIDHASSTPCEKKP